MRLVDVCFQGVLAIMNFWCLTMMCIGIKGSHAYSLQADNLIMDLKHLRT